MHTLDSLISEIPPLDATAMRHAQTHLDGLLKPPGSLGRLESLAVQLAGMPGLAGKPQAAKKAIIVMCADHGVYHEQVTISPKAVTAIQAMNMLRHNTGVCVLAKQAGAEVDVIDIGIDSDPLPGIKSLKVARGSGNIAREPAMTVAVARALLVSVMAYTRERAKQGVKVFGVGELGMANTTPAAAMVSVLAEAAPADVVGLGANFPAEKLAHKVAVVQQAIAVNQPDARDGVDVLAKVGGYDLLGMTGVILGAARCGLPVVLDGFLSYAAALAACRIAPQASAYLIPSHCSAEKGATIALQALGLQPYLHMEMRLGEGSGAALAMHLVDAACAIYHEMGSLAQSNIQL